MSGDRRPYSVLLDARAAGLVGRSAGRKMFLARSRRTPHATAESTRAVVRLPPTFTTRSGGGRMAALSCEVATQFFCAVAAERERSAGT